MAGAQYFQSLQGILGSIGEPRRVLLLNPPVHETNYRWLQWNQPLDLLKLAAWLRLRAVDVKLFDFLLPGKGERVARRKLDRDWEIHGLSTDAWHFGRPIDDFREYVNRWSRTGWVPDCIIVTTLTSYWIRGLRQLVLSIRQLGSDYRGIPIVVYGNLPRYCPKLSTSLLGVTHVAPGGGEPIDAPAAFDLYEEMGGRAQFCALDAHSLTLCNEVHALIEDGYTSFTFFNDDIFSPGSRVADLAEAGIVNSGKIHFDIICGAVPSRLTSQRLEQLRLLNVRSMCVDYEIDERGGLVSYHYERIRDFSLRTGFLRRAGHLSGFVDFGLPGEDFDLVVHHTLLVNKWLGGVILKPFGVLCETSTEEQRSARWQRHEDQSPHAFPYLTDNRAQVEDYLNLYRWQALLNYRNRGATFDFLANTLLGKCVRESVVSESWTLENIIKEGERGAARSAAHSSTVPSADL